MVFFTALAGVWSVLTKGSETVSMVQSFKGFKASWFLIYLLT